MPLFRCQQQSKKQSKSFIDDNNPVGVWLKENYDITDNEDDIVKFTEIYDEYWEEVDRNIKKGKFSRCMKFNGFIAKHSSGKIYIGIKKKEEKVIKII